MKVELNRLFRPAALRALTAAIALGAAAAAPAAQTDLSSTPLETSVATAVRPNLLFTLDDSGSMGSDYLPDYVVNSSGFCRSGTCDIGDVPYYANAFNGVFYNPQVTYTPAVKWDQTSYGNQSVINVQTDPYTNPGNRINLTNSFPDAFYCKGGGTGNCKQNGIDTPAGAASAYAAFDYWNQSFPATVGGNNYNNRNVLNVAPFYYDIVPVEYCSDVNLTNCTLSAVPTGIFQNPAYVRFCQTSAQATSVTLQSDPLTTAVPKCISKYVSQTGVTKYTFGRYGKFKRTDIIAAKAPFGSRPNRSDCAAAPSCTYAEESTNFANWYAFYRTRILMMKTATGLAFKNLDDRYRIGFMTIHPITSSNFVPVKPFDSTQKQSFYSTLYSRPVGSATPLREALSRAGRYFANVRTGINSGINDDPMEYSCQPNYVLLTTDGYWNTGDPVDLKGNSMASTDVDNTNTGYATRGVGAYDGNIGSKGTLADTALYYYQTDLRNPSLNNCTSGSGTNADVCKDNVPTSPADPNKQQHVTLFTLGLVDGLMRYQTDYDTSLTGDFAKIKSSSTGCYWASGTCNWPVPASDAQSALDDLWHAAVNARGKYYNARDPQTLSTGLNNALQSVTAVTASAAAAATSTPNVTPTDNFVFSSTYRSGKWDGEVIAQQIDTTSGAVIPAVLWSAQAQLDGVPPASRKIYFSNGTTLKDFTLTNLTTVGRAANFTTKCATLSQCSSLTVGQQATLNSGDAMVNYLRGDKTNEGAIFRARDHVLGDTVNAVPAFVSKPTFQFGDAVSPDYAAWKNSAPIQSRGAALYVGANDGMLHAFSATSGAELWAYVPTMVMQNMPVLADLNYSIKHTYYADGSPTTMDAYFSGNWHTVLVAGLNKGGQGYYALDVTNPTAPILLWEICNDATLCGVANSDKNIGYTYGNPVVTKRKSDGKWVVLFTSGYNNTTGGGDGKGWLYEADLVTGNILSKVSTGTGDTTTPSGLAKITGVADNFSVDNTATTVYGGDLLGNVWKFDLAVVPPTVQLLAQVTDSASKAQPVTTKPEVAKISGQLVVYVTTGAYLGVTDVQSLQTQSVYAFKDNGTSLGALRFRADIVSNTITVAGSTASIAKKSVDWTTQTGWRVDLPDPGERVSVDPQLIQGTLLVTSNQPDTNACNTGGESFLYQFDYANPQAVTNSLGGTTLGTRIGGAVAVGLTVIKLPDGTVKAIVPLADTTKQVEAVNIGSGSLTTRRIGWRQLRN